MSMDSMECGYKHLSIGNSTAKISITVITSSYVELLQKLLLFFFCIFEAPVSDVGFTMGTHGEGGSNKNIINVRFLMG